MARVRGCLGLLQRKHGEDVPRLQKLGGSTSSIVYLAADPLDELLFFTVHQGSPSALQSHC